jgi:hypothetical protein
MSIFSESSDEINVDMSHIWVSPASSEHSEVGVQPDSPSTPSYLRELVNALDTCNVLAGVNLDDEAEVRSAMYGLKRDVILTKLVRLQELHKLMSFDFTPEDICVVEAAFAQTAAGLNEADRTDVLRLTTLKKRTDVLNRAVTQGLLDEDRDRELFGCIIRAHAKSLAPPAPV